MQRQQRITVDLAAQILQRAMLVADKERVDTVPVRLALQVLWHDCPERWPLVIFWDASGQANEIGRAQGTTAAFNGIVRQLRTSGAHSGKSI